MLGRYINTGGPVSDHPLNYGLVGWWLPLPGNQGGSRLFDLKGKYPATLKNAPGWCGGRSAFAALSFDATDDYVEQASLGNAINGITSATFSVWVRLFTATPASIATSGLVDLDTVSQATHYPYTDGLAYVGTFRTARVNGITPLSSVNRTEWHMVTVTTDGTTWRFYQNAQEAANTGAEATVSADASFWLGGSGTGGTDPVYFLDGRLTDCRIYNRALSASEVGNLYLQGVRDHPDTLRRYSRTAYLFATVAAAPSNPIIHELRPDGASGASRWELRNV